MALNAYLELMRVVRYKQEELPFRESNFLESLKSTAMMKICAGTLIVGGLTWAMGGRLSMLPRISISVGNGFSAGCFLLSRSVDSIVDQILSLDGSLMQKELATIITERHWKDHSRMQLIRAKLFYEEKVFDDSTSEQARVRWRYRNYFSDDVAFHQSLRGSDFHDSSRSNAQEYFDSTSNIRSDILTHNDSDGRKNDLEHTQVNMNTGPGVMEDPLDCVFGFVTAIEDIHNPSPSSMPTRRGHKRSHRRRQLHRHEIPSEHHA